jgi:hypothetical protein
MSLRQDDPQARQSALREGSRGRTALAGRPGPVRPVPEESPAGALSQRVPRSGMSPRPTAIHPLSRDRRQRQIPAQHRPESHALACLRGGARRSPVTHSTGLAPQPERPAGPGPPTCAVPRAGPLAPAVQRKHPNRVRVFPNAHVGQTPARRLRVSGRFRVSRWSWVAGCFRAAGRFRVSRWSWVAGCFRAAGQVRVAACIRTAGCIRAAAHIPVAPSQRDALRWAAGPATADVATVAPAGCPAAGRCRHHPDSPCGERIVQGGEAKAVLWIWAPGAAERTSRRTGAPGRPM